MPKYVTQEEVFQILTELNDPFGAKVRTTEAMRRISAIPAADVVEVVRCRDCKRYRSWGKVYERKDYTGLCTEWSNMSVNKNDYCSKGARKSNVGGKKNDK